MLVGGVPGAVALALVGCCVIGTFGVTMVMSQQYLPSRIGMASGLSIGMSIGLGGIAAVALGAVADSIDLQAALLICAAAPSSRPRSPCCSRAPRGASSRRSWPRPHEVASRRGRDAREFFETLEARADPVEGGRADRLVPLRHRRRRRRGRSTSTTARSRSPRATADADCTISASEQTFERIVAGEQNPTTAYMTGKLKVAGDMGQALKLQKLF